MSFCFDVKEELCKIEYKDDTCRLAELYGMLLFSQSVSPEAIKVSTENVLVINRLQFLAAKLFGLFFQMTENGVTYTSIIKDASYEKLKSLFRFGDHYEIADQYVFSQKLFFSFLRGAVLSGGYFNDPVNRYHFELVASNVETAKSMMKWMNHYGFPVKMVARRLEYVVYLKDSQMIYNLLYKIGARNAAFALMNIKIEKETNNNNNRMDNCAAYNMDKALNKAVEQVRAIEKIRDTVGLESLPEDLARVAELRLNHQTDSLTELSAVSGLSKPSVSRKLKKIVEFSDGIKG